MFILRLYLHFIMSHPTLLSTITSGLSVALQLQSSTFIRPEDNLMVPFPARLPRHDVRRVDDVEDGNSDDHGNTVEGVLVDFAGNEVSVPALDKLDGPIDTSYEDHGARDTDTDHHDLPSRDLLLTPIHVLNHSALLAQQSGIGSRFCQGRVAVASDFGRIFDEISGDLSFSETVCPSSLSSDEEVDSASDENSHGNHLEDDTGYHDVGCG